MKDFLLKHKAEVIKVCLTEFDEELYKETIREDAFTDGIEKGKIIGYIDSLKDFGLEAKEIVQKIMNKFNLSEKEVFCILSEIGEYNED